MLEILLSDRKAKKNHTVGTMLMPSDAEGEQVSFLPWLIQLDATVCSGVTSVAPVMPDLS